MGATTDMRIDRPLDMLHNLKQSSVVVRLKDNEEINCFLLAFDLHLNLAVELDNEEKEKLFIPGHMVHSVKA